MTAVPDEVVHHRTTVSDLAIHYVELCPADDIDRDHLVVLLHGFPEHWYAWRHQLRPLADAGFHVVAPDLRGYNRSDRPDGVAAYRMDCLLADLRGLVEHLDPTTVSVVGHDWGGAIVWEAAVRDPTLVDRQVVLNFPHPGPYRRELLTWRQLRRSWYIGAFLLPRVPEAVLRRDDYAFLDRLFREDTPNPDAFTDADIARYRDALARPGALTAAVNYYRALVPSYSKRLLLEALPFGDTGLPATTTTIDTPTLVLWGDRDSTVVPEMAAGLDEWVTDVSVEHFPDAGHWLQEERPDAVTRELVAFLGDRGRF